MIDRMLKTVCVTAAVLLGLWALCGLSYAHSNEYVINKIDPDFMAAVERCQATVAEVEGFLRTEAYISAEDEVALADALSIGCLE